MKAVSLRLSVCALAVSLWAGTAGAAVPSAPKASGAASSAARTVAVHVRDPYVGAIVAEAATGKVLFSDHADDEAYPASVTKLMTALLVLEDIAAGKYDLRTRATATPEVYHSEASWIGIKAGESMTVDDLLMALLVKSANDAAIVLGVHSSGSLDAFIARMNARAAELGMTGTRYFNPNGLNPGINPNSRRRYPWKEFNRTTARDQLKLALEVVKHPEIFRYTASKTATVTGGDGKLLPRFVNHNNILVKDKLHIVNPDGSEAVDGLKTGYTMQSGSSIVLTGKRSGKRAIVVVLGSVNSTVRDAKASTLLTDALDALVW